MAMAQNREVTAKRRGQGRPFEKGKSGNPGGRPAIAKDVRALLAENSSRAAETVIALLDSTDEKVALAAAREILDRVMGKTQPQATSETGQEPKLDVRAQIHAILLEREKGGLPLC